MPKLRLNPVTARDLEEYLADASDFAFELRTLTMLRAHGLECEHGGLYEDPVTKKSRQFDIRAVSRDCGHCVRLAIECKNISAHFPLLISCIPRHPDESFHEIAIAGEIEDGQCRYGLYDSRAHVHRLVDEWSIYRAHAPVGKTVAQVGREASKENTIHASDQDMFDKWAQCLASADELVGMSAWEGSDDVPSISYVAVLPMVVVPDERLWMVEYDNDGSLKAGPVQTDRCSLFVNHAYDMEFNGPTLRISHIEFLTLSGLRDQLHRLRQTARQIVFRTGIGATPVTIGGTYFLVAYHKRLFAVTAKHVVGDAVPEQLLLDTSDHTWIPARVLEQFNSSDEKTGALDLVVYDLDTRHFTAKHRRRSRAYNMPLTDTNWRPSCYERGFFLFGYPLARTTVDYGALTTQADREQWFINAKYYGPSELSNCHALRLLNPTGLSDLNGLSGSPVFAYEHTIGIEVRPSFVGIVLRGTASSGLVHFLEVRAVRAILEEILRRPLGTLPKKWRSLRARARRSSMKHQ